MPLLFRPVLGLAASLVGLAVALGLPTSSQPAKTSNGELLFKQRCAPCHGSRGEGAKAYPKALTGPLSVNELSKFIAQSMPPGAVHCPAADAGKIAPYIFKAFYSPVAQERIRPVRVELERLTVRQFRNAVADLVGDYHAAVPSVDAKGLHGEYFKGRNFDQKERVLDRVDPQVTFDFGIDGPSPKLFDPYNFSVSWEGSVLAPDSGDYEFVIQSNQAVRMWVNNDSAILIDGFVRSAGQKEFRGSLNLLGGRAYHVRLEFSKATQGVDDQKKKTTPVPKAFINLRWRRPNHAEETIPSFYLFPQWSPRTFVVTSHFPPDDRSTGYERGDAITKDWDDATTAAALETAGYIASHMREVTGVSDDAKDRKTRLQEYCKKFVTRAFRRPLSPEVQRLYVDKQFEVASDVVLAVKRCVVLTLKSPQFLYREMGGQTHDSYFVASQLSFGLWDSLPDPELQSAAEHGDLSTREGAQRQASRMVTDFRSWNKLREFLFHWLKLDEVPDIVKNPQHYPGFDQAAVSDLRTSLELYLQNIAWSKTSDYRDLMLSDSVYLNGDLAKIYGVDMPPTAPFQPVKLDPGGRLGVIAQPYLLSRLAYLDGSSPIHRGVLIFRNMLGRLLNPPPSNFVPLAASLHPDFTTRERVALQTKPAFCASCHGIVNPLGYTLEEFDAIGRYRAKDNNKPVDSNGFYRSRNGTLAKFSNERELAEYLATSDDAREAFVEKLFVHEVKQPPMAYGTRTLGDLQQEFAKNQYSIRSLLVSIAVRAALPNSKEPATQGTPTK